MEYHCHLNGKAKEMFGNYDMEEMEINRRDTKQQGIPKSEKYLANGCVKYDNENKNGYAQYAIKKEISIVGGS